MNKVLVIAPVFPYKKIPNAGGKTLYYYLSELNKKFELKIISLLWDYEKDIINDTGFDVLYEKIGTRKIDKIIRRIIDWSFFYNPYDTFANLIPWSHRKKLYKIANKIKSEGYCPDIIILESTGIVFLVDEIKSIFPSSRIVASEVDVTYLKYLREYELKKSRTNYKRYKRCKRKEIKSLKLCDKIITQNDKDKILLTNEEIASEKILTICPFFSKIKKMKFNGDSKNILFFGAMDRKENYLSAIWFIKNVMPSLSGFTFRIVGNNPNAQLIKYCGNNVLVEGYVEDINEVFSGSLCLVSPLLLGAGIKVKVIEAMSCGIVTLTNDIGIEGIPATPNKEYIHCESAEEYIKAISSLHNKTIDGDAISQSSIKFIDEFYNLENSTKRYCECLHGLVE